ncbi:hypothetical protein [Nocardia otitidiscaviarum]|uniref:Rv0361 family membrane protein n=1 Tax=Nocardia otitidiscaviarum TaxID=1823 RepID=UPI00245607A4|nr:hypothetical protein [Nocardia otitidiscaviarum]
MKTTQLARVAIVAGIGTLLLAATSACGNEPENSTSPAPAMAGYDVDIEQAIRKQIDAVNASDLQTLRDISCGYLAGELNSSGSQVLDAIDQGKDRLGQITVTEVSKVRAESTVAVAEADLVYSKNESANAIEYRLLRQNDVWKICSTDKALFPADR